MNCNGFGNSLRFVPGGIARGAAKGGDVPETEDVGTILDVWGPPKPLDERSFYACPPHRIETTARLIRDGYLAEHANAALADEETAERGAEQDDRPFRRQE
jgi:hypothetical protein